MEFVSGKYLCFVKTDETCSPKRVKVVAYDHNRVYSTNFNTVTLVNNAINQIQIEYDGIIDILQKKANGEKHIEVEVIEPNGNQNGATPILRFCHDLVGMRFSADMAFVREMDGSPISQDVKIHVLNIEVTMLINSLAELRAEVEKNAKQNAEITSTILDQFSQIRKLIEADNGASSQSDSEDE